MEAAALAHANGESSAQTSARSRDSGKAGKMAKYGKRLETTSFHLEQKNVAGQFQNGSRPGRRVTDVINRVNFVL